MARVSRGPGHSVIAQAVPQLPTIHDNDTLDHALQAMVISGVDLVSAAASSSPLSSSPSSPSSSCAFPPTLLSALLSCLPCSNFSVCPHCCSCAHPSRLCVGHCRRETALTELRLPAAGARG